MIVLYVRILHRDNLTCFTQKYPPNQAPPNFCDMQIKLFRSMCSNIFSCALQKEKRVFQYLPVCPHWVMGSSVFLWLKFHSVGSWGKRMKQERKKRKEKNIEGGCCVNQWHELVKRKKTQLILLLIKDPLGGFVRCCHHFKRLFGDYKGNFFRALKAECEDLGHYKDLICNPLCRGFKYLRVMTRRLLFILSFGQYCSRIKSLQGLFIMPSKRRRIKG